MTLLTRTGFFNKLFMARIPSLGGLPIECASKRDSSIMKQPIKHPLAQGSAIRQHSLYRCKAANWTMGNFISTFTMNSISVLQVPGTPYTARTGVTQELAIKQYSTAELRWGH